MVRACDTYGEKHPHKVLVRKLEQNRLLGRPKQRWVILKCTLNKHDGRVWLGFTWIRIGTSDGLL